MTSQQPNGLLKALALAGVLGSAAASAAPGDHIRSGNLTVTPSVRLGFDYRSNAFRAATDPQGTGGAVIAPGVKAHLKEKEVDFNLGASYSIQKYLFLGGVDDTGARRQLISNLDRFNNIQLDSGLKVKSQPVGATLGYNLVLRNNPSDIDLDSDDPYTTQFRNAVNAGLDISPGAALTITPGFAYTWTQYFVPSNDAVREAFNTKSAYRPRINLSYRFLPRTAFVSSVSYTLNRWKDNAPEVDGATLPVNDSGLGRAEVGVRGRLTERLKVVLSAGSGFGKFSDGLSLNPLTGLVAVVAGTYNVMPNHSVNLGFRKSFFDSFFTNSVSVASIQGGWNGKYGEKLNSSLSLGTRFETYDGPITRNDQVTRLNANLGYNFTNWAQANVGGGWLQRRSDPDHPEVEYDDVNVRLNAVFTY